MKYFSFLSLGLLLALVVGCTEATEETYEVEKPVITEPAPDTPVVVPDDNDSDLNVDDADVDLDLNDNDAVENDAIDDADIPDATQDSTSGAIENEDALENSEPATP